MTTPETWIVWLHRLRHASQRIHALLDAAKCAADVDYIAAVEAEHAIIDECPYTGASCRDFRRAQRRLEYARVDMLVHNQALQDGVPAPEVPHKDKLRKRFGLPPR